MNALEFDRLVQKYQSLVYTICRQLVADEGYAQDLTQETFLSAWRSMDRCPAGYEKQWLARIASNKAKDYLRSAWARRVNTPGDDVLALEGAPPNNEKNCEKLSALLPKAEVVCADGTDQDVLLEIGRASCRERVFRAV